MTDAMRQFSQWLNQSRARKGALRPFRGLGADHLFFKVIGKLIVALTITIILATAAGAAERAAVQSLLEARQERVVIQKWDLSCGAAALATILKYQYGEPVTERKVALELMQRKEYLANPSLVQARQGFSLLDLQRAVERLRRYKGVGLGQLTLRDLTQRAPLIVPVSLYGYDHFVVFRGVYRGRVLLADPAWGNRTMPVATFARIWREYPQIGRIGFLVTPRDGVLRANRLAPRPQDFVIAPVDFDDDDRFVDFRRPSRRPIILTDQTMDTPVAAFGSQGSVQVLMTGPAVQNQTLPGTSSEQWSPDVTSLSGVSTSLPAASPSATSLLTTITSPVTAVIAPLPAVTAPISAVTAPVSSITAPLLSVVPTVTAPTRLPTSTALLSAPTAPVTAPVSLATTPAPLLSSVAATPPTPVVTPASATTLPAVTTLLTGVTTSLSSTALAAPNVTYNRPAPSIKLP